MNTCPADQVFACEHVTRRYEGVPTVEGVSLSLRKAEMASLLGPSGVGKTTLFNVLAGVDRPDEGRVLLGGEDITGCPGRVGYMLQKDLLLEFRTVVYNCALPLLLRGVRKPEAFRRVRELLPVFGLEGSGEKYPRQLSGGMRQRAALLRTCLPGRDVILLDEPFSALDAITRAGMRRWYIDIIGELGAATLFVTHDVDEAVLLSDTVYILSGAPGRVSRVFRQEAARVPGFELTERFLDTKRKILSALGES